MKGSGLNSFYTVVDERLKKIAQNKNAKQQKMLLI
jgi:hypothetical protein